MKPCCKKAREDRRNEAKYLGAYWDSEQQDFSRAALTIIMAEAHLRYCAAVKEG